MEKNEMREVIAKRAAKELHDGDVVNLGIGIPTMIPNYLPDGVEVTLQTENGAMGMGNLVCHYPWRPCERVVPGRTAGR